MTSNMITVGNAATPSTLAEVRPKARSPEGAAHPTSAPDLQPKAALTVTASSSSGVTAPETKPQETKDQETKSQEAKTLDRQGVASVVDELNERIKGLRRTGLQFNLDDKVDQLVVKVMDVEKDEVIRQIPPEELLELAAFLKERADKEAQQNEWAALTERGLAPKAAATPEGWLVDAKA